MRPRQRLALVCAAAALLAVAPAARAAAHVRGVRPEQADAYVPKDGKFTCLDGTRILDFSAVNNDYCDCADGSDEPGTSACANGVFYCRNRGHEARVISSAFVDDGVCDCCDGSDELEGCSNTCIEKNAAVRESLKQQVLQYKAALDKRREYAKQAVAARKEMKDKLAGIDGEIAAAEADVKKREAEKEQLEGTVDERRAAREKKRAEEEAALAKQRAEEEAKAAEEAAKAAAEEAARAAAEEAAKAAEGAAAAEGGDSAGGDVSTDEESAEERGRRIASQWTKDPEAAGAEAESDSGTKDEGDKGKEAAKGGWLSSTLNKIKAAVGVAGGGGDGGEDGDEDWDDARTCGEDGVCEEEGEEEREEDADADADADADGESTLTAVDEDRELDAAVEAVTAAEQKVAALKAEKERLARQVTYDYGKDDAWLALRTHCSTVREPQYSYRLCLFDKAAQVDNNAGHETKLGTWRGFEKGYTEGVFDGGDWCHQAPARSMRVTFSCALEESAWGASEPSTCAYAASMGTPAACKEEDLAALQGKLEALIKEEEALRADIEAEEAERRAAFKAAAAAVAAAAAEEGRGAGAAKDEL